LILPSVIAEALLQNLKLTVKSYTAIAGGCINNGGKILTQNGSYFIKWNDAERFPGMFEAEASGLKLLAATTSVRVPSVVVYSEADTFQFILLEFIEQAARSSSYWQDLGRSLAMLHRRTSPLFGLDHDNYIGSLHQHNKTTATWTDFLIHHRLEPQLELLSAPATLRRKFERLYRRLPDMFPIETPSLLHGDLWSGNIICDDRGNPCLIDPAVYFGHREMDIAFTHLFGGFDEDFYDTYKEVFPLQHGFEERVEVCNLYPLLVHANLFGGHYLTQIERIASRWS
jgi:protein-ribulosamine 3-kinase